MKYPAGYVHTSRNGVHWKRNNTTATNAKVPGTAVALLSRPEKMPGAAWTLPALLSCPWAVTGPGTICGGCYGNKRGRYRMNSVQDSMATRWEWTRRMMATEGGRVMFVAVMVDAIGRVTNPFFRGHEVGDFFSVPYVRCWIEICQALPDKHFWFPTRSYQHAPMLAELVRLNALQNVAVRPSALRYDDPPPVVPGLAAGTTVSLLKPTCPARTTDHHCADCRICWLDPEKPVAYELLSGGRGKAKAS